MDETPLQPEPGAPYPCLSPPGSVLSGFGSACLLPGLTDKAICCQGSAPLVLLNVLATQDHDTLPQTPLKMQLFQPREPAFQPQVFVQILLSYSDCRSTTRPWATLLSLARDPLLLQTLLP